MRGSGRRLLLVEPETGATCIESIVVARDWQGRQIGTHLVGAVLAEIVGRRKQPVRLQVSSANVRARAMYERLGFMTVTQSMRYRALREDVQSRLG